VGEARPQAHELDPRAAQLLAEDADDAGRPLVVRRPDRVLLEPRILGGEAGHDHRARVDDVRQVRAEHHHAAHPEAREQREQLLAVAPPAQVRLRPPAEQQLAPRVHRAVAEEGVRPRDASRAVLADRDLRPRDGEVEELLAVDLRKRRGPEVVRDVAKRHRGRFARVVPALEREQQRRLAQRGSDEEPKRIGHSPRVTAGRAGFKPQRTRR
jgi:hypothetical protein